MNKEFSEAGSPTLLPASDPQAIDRAVRDLHVGKLVAFPTDTVYGLGARAWDERAVERLFQAKQRSWSKAIPLLLPSAEHLGQVCDSLPALTMRLAERFWPGPLTLVVPRHPRVGDLITAGGATVAVRVPDHPVALALLARIDQPLATSSANLSGQPNPLTARDVVMQLGDRIDLVLDGGACPGGLPSTVVDLTIAPIRILRAGPLVLDDLLDAI